MSSLSPGFKKVLIKPHFGAGDKLQVSFPHHAGTICLDLQKQSDAIIGTIHLPKGIEAIFH
ncbi:MAG: alpha-L-rhamnosidase C-terminal domain-containing protein [Bacteroidota bacterium]